MDPFRILWLIAAVVFFYFAILFWVYSRSKVRPFILGSADQPGIEQSEGISSGIPEDLQREIESFRKSISLTMQTRFRIGAISLALAGGLAILSMLFS